MSFTSWLLTHTLTGSGSDVESLCDVCDITTIEESEDTGDAQAAGSPVAQTLPYTTTSESLFSVPSFAATCSDVPAGLSLPEYSAKRLSPLSLSKMQASYSLLGTLGPSLSMKEIVYSATGVDNDGIYEDELPAPVPPLVPGSGSSSSESSRGLMTPPPYSLPYPMPIIATTIHYHIMDPVKAIDTDRGIQETGRRETEDVKEFAPSDSSLGPEITIGIPLEWIVKPSASGCATDITSFIASAAGPSRNARFVSLHRFSPTMFVQPKQSAIKIIDPQPRGPSLKRKHEGEREDGKPSQSLSAPDSPQRFCSNPSQGVERSKAAPFEQRRPSAMRTKSWANQRWDDRLKNKQTGARMRVISTDTELLTTWRKVQPSGVV